MRSRKLMPITLNVHKHFFWDNAFVNPLGDLLYLYLLYLYHFLVLVLQPLRANPFQGDAAGARGAPVFRLITAPFRLSRSVRSYYITDQFVITDYCIP